MSNVNVPGSDARIGGSYASAFNIASHLGGQLNIPELILAIQVERGQILDNQIKDQMEEMQKRNATLRDLNAAMAAIRNARPEGKPETTGNIANVTFTNSSGETVYAVDYLAACGVDVGVDTTEIAEARDAKAAMQGGGKLRPDGMYDYPSFADRNGNTVNADDWGASRNLGHDLNSSDNYGQKWELDKLSTKIDEYINTKGSLSQTKWDSGIQNIKSAVDTINNQSQMDMVRLQGLMDKRNQAFDMMTNTISKSGKSLDGVIGNMR